MPQATITVKCGQCGKEVGETRSIVEWLASHPRDVPLHLPCGESHQNRGGILVTFRFPSNPKALP